MVRTTSLQQEIRQTRPFSTRGQEALVALLHTTDVVKRQLALAMDAYDITPQQYNVLRILRGAGTDGLPTLEIAERMIERTPGVTRLLERLERKRLVERKRSARDRRQVRRYISPRGLQLLDELDEPIRRADETCMSQLSGRQLAMLSGLLERVRRGAATSCH